MSPDNLVYRRTYSVFCIVYRQDIYLKNAVCALVCSSQFSRNFTTWISLLSMELELLCKNAEPGEDVGLASYFKPFPNLRVILDCTELYSETPSSVEYHKQTHNNYKHHFTKKSLVGIHPSGADIHLLSWKVVRQTDHTRKHGPY